MQIFLDSADLSEIRQAADLGLLDGVTMNPALLAGVEQSTPELVQEICSIVHGPVSVPVRAHVEGAIVDEGRELAALHEDVVVKIPIHTDGLRAIARLQSEGIRTHATLCCSAVQAMLAAKSGAFFVSPFVARIDAVGSIGIDVVAQIIDIYDNYDYDTRVMVASLRNTLHVQEAAVLGVDACTMSLSLMRELARHPLSESLHTDYLAAWKRS